MTEKRSMKDRGADTAAAYLERVGIGVIERSWSSDVGRIDVLGWDGDTLVVVDVVTRKAGHQESEQWAPTPARVRRTKRLVKAYIDHADLDESTPWRYDRVDLLVLSEGKALLRHHRNALTATE